MTALIETGPIAIGRRSSTSAAARNAGLDALRATMTLLVLFHHTAITYGAIGGWFYREVPTDGRFETKLLIFFCSVNQAYFMGLFFLLAGYFTPRAVTRNGALGYLGERLLRLGLPLVIFGVILGPVTMALAQTAQGRSFATTLLRLWTRGTFENGPLWFAQALLMFAAVYLVVHWMSSPWRATPSEPGAIRPFPSHLALALAALATGAFAFALRLVWPVGVQAYGLQPAYFASYIVLFGAGCVGASSHWLDVPASRQRIWLIVALVALPILPIVVLSAPHVPALQGNTNGGWNIQAVTYAFWEPLVAWGIILTLLRAFERRFATLGPIWTALARRAYLIFIIHPPVLVAVALAWRGIEAPHLVKFAVTGTATCLVCYLLAGLLLRLPGVSKVV